MLCRHQNSWNNNLLTYRTVNSSVLTSYTVNSNILIAQSIPMYLLMHNQFQCNYCIINSNVLIAQSIPLYLFTAQSIPMYLLHSQLELCPFLLAICWAFVIIIANSLCVAFCYQRFAQGCGILSLLTLTFSKTFKK